MSNVYFNVNNNNNSVVLFLIIAIYTYITYKLYYMPGNRIQQNVLVRFYEPNSKNSINKPIFLSTYVSVTVRNLIRKLNLVIIATKLFKKMHIISINNFFIFMYQKYFCLIIQTRKMCQEFSRQIFEYFQNFLL